MTSEEHNKYLGIAHLVHGGLQTLWLVLMLIIMVILMPIIAADAARSGSGEAFPVALFSIIMLMVIFFSALFSVPAFVAGYGLLKKKPWAKTWAIISAVLAAMSFPIGTAICVYSFWFLMGDSGKDFYSKPQGVGSQKGRDQFYFERERATTSDARDWTPEREREYAPPPEMPNWRE